MKTIKITYLIALIAIFSQQSSTLARKKRSFPWPSFLGGGGSSNVGTTVETSAEEIAQGIEETPQQEYENSIQHLLPPQPQYEGSIQHLSPGYHYPIWRVHKYNGIHLKPMQISLVPHPNQAALQQPRVQLTQSQMQELLRNQLQFQQLSTGSIISQPNGQFVLPNGQQFALPNGQQFVPSIGQQFVSPNGQQFVSPNGQQFVSPNGQQFLSPNGQQFVSPNGQQFVSPNGQQFVSPNGQQFVSPNGQQFVSPNGQQFATPNGQLATPNGQNRPNTVSPSTPIPPELQELADQFGIKDASKLPSLDEAMSLLGTTSRADTIQTIKELAATPQGMDLIRQFLASDEGAAASEEPQSSNGGDLTQNAIQSQPQSISPQQQSFIPQQQQFIPQQQPFIPQQQFSINQQGLPIMTSGSASPTPHQQYGVPSPYPAKQHEIYGLPNVDQAQAFSSVSAPYPGYYAPRSNIVESVENEANIPHEDSNSSQEVQVPHETYGVPHEEANQDSDTASEMQVPHDTYGVPNPYPAKQHEIYGLPNVDQAQAFSSVSAPYPGIYAPRSNIVESVENEANIPHEDSNSSQELQVPHETYGIPHEEANQDSDTASETQVPHDTYGVPNVEHKTFKTPEQDNIESQDGQQTQYLSNEHEIYGLPNKQQAAFHQQVADAPKQGYYAPHQEYNVPNDDSNLDHETQVSHEVYGIPNETPISEAISQGKYEPQASQALSDAETILELSKPQLVYSIPNQVIENNEVASNEYGPPRADQNQGTSLSHQTYGAPNQENPSSFSNSDQFNDNLEQDISVPHQELAVPSALHTDIFTNDERISRPHGLYSLPHQQFFSKSPNTFRQYVQPQSLATNNDNAPPTQYGPSTQYNGRNSRTQIPIIRQIDNGLDRAHTNLELAERLTTTVRPEAGFLERIGSWTRYFVPPGPTIPIVPPKVEGHINGPVDSDIRIAESNSMPIPKLPELDEPHLDGLPTAPQLPSIHIPSKFIMPPSFNQGQNVHIQQLPTFDSLPNNGQFTGLNEYEVPHQRNPEPFDGQSVEEFVPDISQLPLQYKRFSKDPQFLTSYGTVTHPHSYSNDDSDAAASEIHEQRVAVVLPQKTVKRDNRIDNDIVDNDKFNGAKQISEPQRISTYESYATGNIFRADENALNQLIPTQKPLYPYRGKQQLEDSSIIDAVATMTSGFRPIN